MKHVVTTAVAWAWIAAAAVAESADAPKWENAADGFVYRYAAGEGERVTAASVQYPGDEPVSIEAAAIRRSGDNFVEVDVPSAEDPRPGMAVLRLTLSTGETVETEVPVSYYLEIDITGPAAESLYTPLPTDDYLVDYIPCCNIYGGLLIAERIPVNPWHTGAGLPETLLTDFVQLTPDGLTASTMGLYFEFGYESELPGEQIGLYEFGTSEWREAFDYTVDPESKRVRFHCPDGGTFVVAAGEARATGKTD